MATKRSTPNLNSGAGFSSKENYAICLLGLPWSCLLESFLKTKNLLFVWPFRELVDGTINSDVYCGQLQRVNEILGDLGREERVIFLHDNARPHTSNQTKQMLTNLDWEVLPHPPYSPDIAPSDYHLFRSLKSWLKGKKFDSVEEVREGIQEFFNSKDEAFYARGINNLIDRWEQIVAFDGEYL